MSLELEAVAEFLTGNRMTAPILPWQLLRREDVRVLRDWAGETLPGPSQRRLMRELRRALKQEAGQSEDLPAGTGLTPSMLRAGERRGAASKLASRQVRLLIEGALDDESLDARRDSAIVVLMLLAGLRRTEIVRLQRGSFDDEDGRLKISGRPRCSRSVILDGVTREEVERWLRLRGSWSGPLFAAIGPKGELVQRALSPSAVNRLLSRRAREAGCDGVTPRDLRGRFLWQLQSMSRERPVCRYYQDENGQPGWVLPSMASV
jgi:integrase